MNSYQSLIKISFVFGLTLLSHLGDLNAHCGNEDPKEINKKFKEHEAQMAPNDAEIQAADETNDLIERLRVRKIIIERSRKAANFAEEYHDYDTMQRYRNYQHQRENQLPAIEADIDKKFEEIENEMSTNDAEIEASRTQDYETQIHVLEKIINRSTQAANFAQRYTEVTGNRRDTMERYRNYQHHVENLLSEVKEKFKKNNEQKEKDAQAEKRRKKIIMDEARPKLEAQMALNDVQIEAADKTNDLIERLRVRKIIIERSREAANFAEAYHDYDTMKRYRNYQHHVENQLPAIETDIDKKFDKIENEMSTNDAEIEASQTQDLVTQIHVLEKLIALSASAADFSQRYFEVTGNRRNTMERHQNYKIHAEKLLSEVKTRLKEKQKKEETLKAMFKLKNEAWTIFEEEGRKYQTHLMMDQNKEKLSKADDIVDIITQVNMRKEVIQQTVNTLIIAELFIEKVNDWNNQWGAYERIEGNHPWSIENIRKDIEEYNIFRNSIEKKLHTLEKILEEEGLNPSVFALDNKILSLKSINIDILTGAISFVLENENHYVWIKGNLHFIEQYIEQKGRKIPSRLPFIERNRLPIFGIEEESEDTIKLIVSHITKVLPLFKTVKSINKLISDDDSGWEVNLSNRNEKHQNSQTANTYDQKIFL